MNRKYKISTGNFLHSLLLLLMMGWMGSAWAQTEQLIYSTDFTEWDNIDRETTIGKTVTQWTDYSNEPLTFTLNGVGVDPKGTNSKFANYTGYLITAKYTDEYSKGEPSVVTSPLDSITKIVLTQAATGGTRGIKVSVSTDGVNWDVLYKTYTKTGSETLTIPVNRKNCQIKFENLTLNQNAYIVDLKIYGSPTGSSNRIKMLTFEPQEGIIGKYPTKIKCDKDGKAVIPSGNTFSKPGYTFESWTDGTNEYTPGDTCAFTTDVTLKPKMRANSYHLYDNNQAAKVVWSFDPAKSPAINIFSSNSQKDLSYALPVNIYIDENTQETQDVALGINVGKNGKVDNTSSTDIKGALVKAGTTFTIPAIYGMKVAFNASPAINEVTYQEDADTYTYTMAEDCNLYDITVTYPVLPDVVTENEIATNGYTFPNEKKELAGSATITLNSPHLNTGKRYKPGETITLSAQPEYGYQIKEFRVKGSHTPLTMTETTDAATGKKTATYTVTEGINTLQVVYEHRQLYKVQAQVDNYKTGSITLEPNYPQFAQDFYQKDENGRERVAGKECWYTEGTEVSVSVEGAEGYIVNSWKINEETKELADNLYTFTVGQTATAISVNLKEGIQGTVVFDYTSANVNGKTEAYKNAESMMPITTISNAKSFTIPTNYTFFKNIDENGKATEESYTLQHWVDQEDNKTIYELGHTYSFSKPNITLVPYFKKNPTTQINRVTNPTIRYDFGRKIHYYDDPDTLEQRKVCAQAVNIGSNEKPFWTSKVFVTTLKEGKQYKYMRDVAMWCDTGKKGFIRNTDQEEWAAFGPGTTFWVAAGAGTRISMMTYSPITSTTIDGVVPTLDEARTQAERQKAGDNHRYVYAYTTQNPELRIPIVIGDDYSYYQWIELATLAANKMNLKVKVDNPEHGKITKVTAEYKNDEIKLEDGSYLIRQGDKVTIEFERLFGYEFDKIVDHNQNAATYEYNKLTPHDPTPEEKKQGKRTSYTLEFEINTHCDLEICFKEKTTYYITYKGGPNAMGSAPQAAWVEEGDDFTIPENRTLYYEGHTLDHWEKEISSDAQETTETPIQYEIGQAYTAEAKDLVLYPVFRTNEFNIFDIENATTATWHFAQKDGAPEILYSGVNGILVTQVENVVNNEKKKIDLKIDLVGNKDDLKNGKSGKFDNTIEKTNGENIVINNGSAINFPATPNCKVKLTATDKAPTSVTIAGKNQEDKDYYTVGDKYIEVTSVQGASHTAAFSANVNAIDFIITYQKQEGTDRTAIQSLTCNGVTLSAEEIAEQMKQNQYVTFNVDVWNKDQNKEEVPKLSGVATANGTVSVTKAPTLTDPEGIITVTTTGGIAVATYPVKLVYQNPSVGLQLTGYKIGNKEYQTGTNEVWDAPESGSIQLNFNHTMQKASFKSNGKTYESEAGTQLVFKYWDLTPGATYQYQIPANTLKDIYGTAYSSDLSLTLHIQSKASEYKHKTFDYVVTKNGDIDAAIAAANAKTGNDRFYIFVPDGEYHIGSKNDNEKTDTLKSNNISLIGQSQGGVTIWNQPKEEGLRKTATLHLFKTATDFYAQDLKLENRFDYASAGSAGRAAAFHDQGNRTIMKNVSLISYQDTYFSNNAGADSRAYFENCDIAGVVDFICGDGNIWFEECNLIHRDRASNNIVAAEQGKIQEWGYVFNNCTIKTEKENPQHHRDYNWTLARPWNDYPTCTFLNTTMKTLPKLTGWGKMDTGRIIRFHEYKSKNADGNLISLSTRSLTACSPGAGSEECVLSDVQAATYTKRNALGGADGFEPDKLCAQINAQSGIIAGREAAEKDIVWKDDIVLEDNLLKWNKQEEALCYFLFKQNEDGKWIYLENTTSNQVNLTNYRAGFYCVRAANQRGGLGGATKTIEYVVADPYALEIKKVEGYKEGDKDYGWTTICLPFNAKVPEEVKAYAATAHNQTDAATKITDFTMTLTPVTVINANKGYVVYGPVGAHDFHPTSRTSDKATILKGNPGKEAIDKNNNNGYVLSYKATWGLGFYKYTGSTLAGNRAWLPKEMVSDGNQESLSLGKRGITFSFAKGATPVLLPKNDEEEKEEPIYNLQGQKVDQSSAHQGIFITRQKGKFYRK